MTVRATTLFAAMCIACLATRAAAHAFLEHAEPAAGSTARKPPRTVCLRFSEPIEPAFSSVRVLDRNGGRVDADDASVDPSTPERLCASLTRVDSGTYTVVWRVLSVDGHVTNGDFTFEFEPFAITLPPHGP